MAGAVQVGSEGDPVGVDLPAVGQGKDLVPAGIGQQRARPTHELVEAAKPGDRLVAGAQVQMVGVGEEQSCAQSFQLRGGDGLDRRLRAYGGEERGEQFAVRRSQDSRPRPAVCGGEVEIHRAHSPQIQCRPARVTRTVTSVNGAPRRR